jgi:C-terminal processing protease CtpA/Prc
MIQRRRSRTLLLSVALTSIVVLGTLGGWSAARTAAQDASGVTTLTGAVSLELAPDTFSYPMLVDLTGFVRRDYDYVQPGPQPIGTVDRTTGDFHIDLPIAPSAPLTDVGHGQGSGPGVQLFSVDWQFNIVGDPALEPWQFWGWSWSNTSLLTEHGTHEVTGGRIAVWAPDAQQVFPTDFGADGRLFTADDPVGPLGAGWTVVDLNQRPFAQIRSARTEVEIGQDESAPEDISQLSPTAAFDELVKRLQARYPYGDDAPVDWDGLRATYRPEFEHAEATGEQVDFWVALNHFLIGLHHWLYFAIYPWADYIVPQIVGTTGLHADMTDDGKLIVAKVDAGGAAETAGIQAGAEIVTWNGKPAAQAVKDIPQTFGESSPQTALSQKIHYFGRGLAGAVIPVTYLNPGATEPVSTELTAVEIPGEQFRRASYCYQDARPCDFWSGPISEYRLSSNPDIAVVRIQTFGTDPRELEMMALHWEHAMQWQRDPAVRGLILDLRVFQNDVTAMPVALYMAGSFFDQPFTLAEITSVAPDGRETDVGSVTVRPNQYQWDRPVAVLVDEWCKQNCELLVQALSHRKNIIIVGMSATAGTLGLQSDPILLPTDNFVQVVDHAFRDPLTHKVLIEGTGIEPTLRVPKTPETIVATATGDPVMEAAVQALLVQAGS